MGVKGLWNEIEPLGEFEDLAKLKGQKVAIDLSCWIVDSQAIITKDGTRKNYLRTLFYRISALLLHGIHPVVVMEGKAPELKHAVIQERKKLKKNQNGAKPKEKNENQGRGRMFTILVKECESMIKLMGLECVQAPGEAEAMCAYLNAAGIVDGCITLDSDCFLYGAKVVYRKFNLHNKGGLGSSVETFNLEEIKEKKGLGRNKMIALALLSGCDYCPGIPRIGSDKALKYLKCVNDASVLDELISWKKDVNLNQIEKDILLKRAYTSQDDKDSIGIEKEIRKQMLKVKEEATKNNTKFNLLNEEIIEEFTKFDVELPKVLPKWKYPNAAKLIEFMSKKVKWEPSYTLQKVSQLRSRWQVENLVDISLETTKTESKYLIPISIEKTRNLKSLEYFEIKWNISTTEWEYLGNFMTAQEIEEKKESLSNFLSVEPQDLVEKSYPELVRIHEESKIKKNEKVPKKKENKPTKSRKRNLEKDLKSNKKIDDFLMKQSEAKVAKTNQTNPTVSRTDSEIEDLFGDLGEEDFETDIEGDLEVTMIVSKLCKEKETLEIDLTESDDDVKVEYVSLFDRIK